MTEAKPAGELPKIPRRRWWVSLLLVVVIFVSGAVVGGGTTLVYVRNRLLYAIHHPQVAPAKIANRLRRKLDLTDEQTAQVEQILLLRQAALNDIRIEVYPRVRAELDLVEQEIAEVLNDEQKQEWHERFNDLRSTWMPPPPR